MSLQPDGIAVLHADQNRLLPLGVGSPDVVAGEGERRLVGSDRVDEAMDGADQVVTIPMVGMIRSLNISVACAVLLYEVFRQRSAAGRYDEPRLSEARIAELETRLAALEERLARLEGGA